LKIEIVHNNSSLAKKLEIFASTHQLVFQSKNWLLNYPAGCYHQCAILNNNADVIGCFYYYRFKKLFFSFVISPVFVPNIDLFVLDPTTSIVSKNSFNKEIMTAMADYFIGLNVDYINLNLPLNFSDTQAFTWKGFTSKVRYTYILNLSQSEEKLWDGLSTEKRKSINKAAKDGLIIEETTHYEQVYALIMQSLTRNDKARNADIIKKILHNYANNLNAIAVVASKNNVPIAATFCLVVDNKALYIFGGFNAENKHHGAGPACMWKSILRAKELGLELFDFEGSMNAQIERYFREFGGVLTPYYCVERIKPLLSAALKFKKNI